MNNIRLYPHQKEGLKQVEDLKKQLEEQKKNILTMNNSNQKSKIGKIIFFRFIKILSYLI